MKLINSTPMLDGRWIVLVRIRQSVPSPIPSTMEVDLPFTFANKEAARDALEAMRHSSMVVEVSLYQKMKKGEYFFRGMRDGAGA